jgi:Mrp family chromosome partitioning ATPase/capsular polysaccharide biosynthesis protein
MIPVPAPQDTHASATETAQQPLRLVGRRPIPRPAAESDSPFEIQRVIGALKYHWFLFVVIGGLAAAGLGAAAYFLIPAKYTTYSIVRVSANDAGVLTNGQSNYRNEFLTFVKTQADALKSEFVLKAALRDSKIANTPTLADVDDKVRWLTENIQVEYSEHSEVMKIVMVGEYPKDLADIINAVQAAYMKEVVLVDQLKKKSSLDTLENSRKQLADRLTNLKKILEEKQTLPLVSSGVQPAMMTEQSVKAHVGVAEFAQINRELRKADIDYTMAVEREKQIRARLDKADTVEIAAPELDAALERDPEFKDLTFRVEKAKQFAQTMANVYANSSHPDVRNAREKLVTAQTAVEDFRRNRKTELSRELQQFNKRQLQDALEKASGEVQARNLLRQTVKRQLETMPPPTKETIAGVKEKSPTDYDTDESGLVYAIGIYEEVLKKLNVMSVDQQNAQPRVTEWQKASIPIKKEIKKQLIGTGFAGLLGFMMVGACITMYEGRVRRLYGSKELSNNPSLNLLGVLPEMSSMDAATAVTDARGLNADPFMEAVEKVRLMLGRNFRSKHAQSILIGSADSGEGKTTLAGHLAISLTKADKKTILVDANLRAPALHEHLGLPAGPGICEVLRGEQGVPDVVQPTAITNLSFLSAGAWNTEAQQGLGRDRFVRILDRLRLEFDYIIIDSHAFSPVADSFLIGQHCDAIVVCARKYVSRKPLVEQTYQRVCELGVPHTGLIFLGESK